MTQQRHRRHQQKFIAAQAARLLLDADTTRPGSNVIDPGEVLEALTVAASITVNQISIALHHASAASDVQAMVTGAFDRAAGFAGSDRQIVGAASLLVDAVGVGDERGIAATVVRCQASFSDDELIRGAAALIAAWNVEIAVLVGIDAVTAHDEIVGRTISDLRGECRRGPATPSRSTRRSGVGPHCARRPAPAVRQEGTDGDVVPVAVPVRRAVPANRLHEAAPVLEIPRRSDRG